MSPLLSKGITSVDAILVVFMIKCNINFCDDFHYPSIVKDIIISFGEICCRYIGEDLVSIMLIGSGARGELTWIQDLDGNLLLYSDLEFSVYTTRKIDELVHKKVEEAVLKFEKPFTDNCHFFHIDFSIAPITYLKRTNNKFITFESKATGKIIYGTDVKFMLPTLDGSNLNFKELNEILLHRLWSMLLYLPLEFLKNKEDCANFNYILCRNVLDITTWLLPYENMTLIAGFKNRLAFMNENWNRLKFKEFFSQDDLQFLNECYEGKMRLKFSDQSHTIYEKAIRLFMCGTKYMLKEYGVTISNEEFQKSILAHSGKLFEGKTLKRKIVETYMIKNKIREYPFWKLLQWISEDKKALSIIFNFNMHLSNLSFLDGDDVCFKTLEAADEFLKKLNFSFNSLRNEYVDKWKQLRKGYADYLVNYERGYQSKKNYFYLLIGINENKI